MQERELISYVATKTDSTQIEIQNFMIQTLEVRFASGKSPRKIQSFGSILVKAL